MKRPPSEADVFAIPQLWQRSRWLDQPSSSSAGQFFSSHLTDITALDANSQDGLSGFSPTEGHLIEDPHLLNPTRISGNESGFFKLPSFEQPHANKELSTLGSSTQQHDNDISGPDDEEDGQHEVWMNLEAPETRPPVYKTWDGFMSGQHPTSQPLCLSESGPSTYDALLSWETDPLELKNTQVPLVETRAYLASLLALAAGRESVFFARSPDSLTFKPALPLVRLSGYSSNSLKGLEDKCMDCGDTLLSLRAFVQTSYTKQSGRCTVALSSALSRILQILQRQLDVEFHNPRSLLQLQSTISKISSVLQPLRMLMAQVSQEKTDENVLSIVFKHACAREYKETFVREIMQEILRVVSLPWLELLEEWIGTKVEEGMPFTKANIGQTKGFVKVESETCIDDFGEEFEDIDYRLDSDRLPEFFPTDVAQLALDTGKNLRFIKSSCPFHPLLTKPALASSRPFNAPAAQWTFGWDDVMKLERKVSKYQNDLKAVISGTANLGFSGPSKTPSATHESYKLRDEPVSLFGSNATQIEQMVLSSMEQFMAPIAGRERDDRFVAVLEHNLRTRVSSTPKHDSIAAPHPSLLPVLSFGSIISAQAEVVNRESLKLLFDGHNLRDHLNLQRSFHLLGNGMFCTRLSHALFDPDLETAERQAGVARPGGVMGLRLGSRDTWPPASSELRLALMGILTESFMAEHGTTSFISASSPQSDSLPGDLSFAVRDLGAEDIERCINPDSLEALDFLRLAYTTPKELRTVITPVVLMQYDRIFKFLVRLLRLMYEVDQLFRVVNLRTSAWHEPGNTAYRFAREARHFVTCIAAYFLDSGIALPWQTFQAKMDQMQAELARNDSGTSERACSPETLRDYHAEAVNQIMSALFLRKRQQPVLKLLEDIFVTVLAYAKHARLQAIGAVVEGDHTRAYSERLYKDFKKKVQVFITVCRTLTEKTRPGARSKEGGRHDGGGIGDDSMVSQLLLKLDINHYYTKA
jgi:hypothetical protein